MIEIDGSVLFKRWKRQVCQCLIALHGQYLPSPARKKHELWASFTFSRCFSPYRRGVSLRIIIIVKSDNDR